jgi:lipoprotein-anchoring transpeptidase ErfK/SrfK
VLLGLILALTLTLGMALPSGGASASDDEVGPSEVYFPQTGHTLKNGFLAYWRHHGDVPIYGYPVSEEFVNPANGLPTQYFERAVFEWHNDNPAGWQALPYLLGVELSQGRQNEPPFKPVPSGDADHCTYYEQTSHRLCNGFRDYWETYGGLAVFGYPISEEFTENGQVVQYFERARFEWHPEHAGTVYEVLLGRLGADRAQRDRIDTKPVTKPDGVDDYSPDLWYVPAPPAPEVPAASLPDGAPTWDANWIDINLSDQYMTAYEYDTAIQGTYISSGFAQYPTPTGYFSIFSKLRYDDMTNGLASPPGEYYYQPDVPWVMYFADGGYAIHGAYWHNMFGTPYSHGCVSEPLWAAEWFYNWAPYGTTVYIHW